MGNRERLGTRRHPDQGVIGWIAKTAIKNQWRVSQWMDIDDLIQDGLERYFITCAFYPGVNPAHRMALFKTNYINHLHTLSSKRSREKEVLSELETFLEGIPAFA